MFNECVHVEKHVCVRSVRLGRNEAVVLKTSRQPLNSVSARSGSGVHRRPLRRIHFQSLALFVLKNSREEHSRGAEAIKPNIPHVIVTRSTKSSWFLNVPISRNPCHQVHTLLVISTIA